MYTDGASNSQRAGIGIVLEAPSGLKIEEAIRLEQSTTNNEAEYEALIYALELAREMGIQRLNVRGDSQLMIEQVAGNFDTKAPHLTSLLQKVTDLRSHFRQFELIQVPREQNQKADALAKLASAGGCTRQSSISISRSSKDMEVYSTSSGPECWMDPIIRYLSTSELPHNPNDAKLLRLRAQRYSIIHGMLYRRSFNGPYLRCLRPSEAKKLLEEIHEGTYGNHTGGRSELPKAARGRRYALVATDYFTKWVVAEAYVTVSKTDTMSFIWKHIICQFGIPWEIVVDNGTPFQNAKVQELCDTYKIKLSFASVTYPQGNGQAEASNKVIFANIKKNLEDKKGAWAYELPKVLWAYRTTKRSSTGESPFAMVYGTEAIIPTEVGLPTLRTEIVSDQTTNNIQLLHNLDLLEEVRTMAQLRRENYQKAAERYYNKRVHTRTFREGDWVLRKVTSNKKKLEPNWKGLFKIIKVHYKPYPLTCIRGALPAVYSALTIAAEPSTVTLQILHQYILTGLAIQGLGGTCPTFAPISYTMGASDRIQDSPNKPSIYHTVWVHWKDIYLALFTFSICLDARFYASPPAFGQNHINPFNTVGKYQSPEAEPPRIGPLHNSLRVRRSTTQQ
ncbi:uncharacterized protein LOC133813860 [Humulus lupulus]|uniref:uncharacterized protein LOC133813860 n=1 Tax=Humulus lupulus TaxID=3486 RepID=UPI002B411FCB|nr:uncharacterized protein LOC133813860 [Humulus lupulus]